MPLYLQCFSYTPRTKKALAEKWEDRSRAAAELAESLGAKVLGYWYSLGEFDGVLVLDAPDNATAAAQAAAVGASGMMSKLETTVLLSVDEVQAAARKAAAVSFRAPGE